MFRIPVMLVRFARWVVSDQVASKTERLKFLENLELASRFLEVGVGLVSKHPGWVGVNLKVVGGTRDTTSRYILFQEMLGEVFVGQLVELVGGVFWVRWK